MSLKGEECVLNFSQIVKSEDGEELVLTSGLEVMSQKGEELDVLAFDLKCHYRRSGIILLLPWYHPQVFTVHCPF